MSLPTWTPAALLSEARPFRGQGWRLVEAQHRVSTLRLVDSLAEQELLEDILEETKPALPIECRHLDYLLSTPFRYTAAYPSGSRFRKAGKSLGVFYASEEPETAVAEMVFYRYLFFAESPGTPLPDRAAEYTAFSVELATRRGLDLTSEPLVQNRESWTAFQDYAACQQLAGDAREADVELIRYESVRDPRRRANLAILHCLAFAEPAPVERQTWRIRLARERAQAVCEYPPRGIELERSSFEADPRLGGHPQVSSNAPA